MKDRLIDRQTDRQTNRHTTTVQFSSVGVSQLPERGSPGQGLWSLGELRKPARQRGKLTSVERHTVGHRGTRGKGERADEASFELLIKPSEVPDKHGAIALAGPQIRLHGRTAPPLPKDDTQPAVLRTP